MIERDFVRIERINQGHSGNTSSSTAAVTSAKEALKSILSGDAILAKIQSDAPLGFMSEMLALIDRFEELGLTAPAGNTHFEKLTRNGARHD